MEIFLFYKTGKKQGIKKRVVYLRGGSCIVHCEIPQGHYIIGKSSYKFHIKYKSLSFILYFVVTYWKPNIESDKHIYKIIN
jgi:hypothetical protein